MSGSSHESVVSWEPSPKGDPPTNTTRQAHYWRSVGWAIAGWVVAAVVVSLVGEVLQLRELAGWAALAGVIVGGWFGGSRGGLTGRREWITFGLILSAILILAIGLGSCAYAMALYG